MNKNTFLITVIVVLLISNLLMLFYIGFFQKNNSFAPSRPRDTVIKKLELSPEQIQTYDKLIVEHQKVIKAKNQKILSIKNELYSTYLMVENEAAKDSLIQEIAITQKEIEQIHFRHFKNIKNICRQDQQSKCAELFKEITSIFPPRPLPKR